MNTLVTLIIPFRDETESLNIILSDISIWTYAPSSIIIINTGILNINLDNNAFKSISELNIDLKIIDAPNVFPGQARNIGFENASTEIIACLDAQTRPNYDWLETGVNSIISQHYDVVWGRTFFFASTFIEKIIRISTYGIYPLRTVPGSIFKRSFLNYAGYFLENVRAGEDGDWMKRAEMHEIKHDLNKSLLLYGGLDGISLNSVIKKWYRNYFASANLPYLKAHIDIYFYFIAVFLIIIAFNWNSLSYDMSIEGWNTNIAAYIPNITKTMISSIICVYLIIRGFILPVRKGSPISYFYKIHYLVGIIIVSFFLDLTKLFAFINSKYTQVFNQK